MKGFLIRGFNANRDYPVNIYRSMLYIEGENLYLKTSDGTFHLSGNISSGGQTNLDNYYTKLEMDSILDNIQIEGYITVEDLSEYITNDKLIEEIAKLNQVDFNIDDYLKIEDLDNNVTSIVDYSIAQLLDGAPEAFDTLREISDWINVNENKTFDLIEHVSLKADKSEIPSIEGLASETFVTEAISAIEFPETDLTAYETKDDNDAKLSLKADKSEIPSIEGLASETFVTEAISAIEFPETDLTAYEKIVDNDAKLLLKADKSELIGLASETFVTEAINDIEFPETDLTNYSTTLEMDSAISEAIAKAQLEGGDVDLNAYETKVDNDAKLLLKADKSELIGLATETFVTEAISAIDFPETDLTAYETKVDNDAKLLLKADKSEIPSIDGLATETFVTEAIEAIEFPEADLTEYEKSIDVDAKLSLKADKSELIGLATETFVTETFGAIEFPETDLTAYETKDDNDAKLLLKADKTYVDNIFDDKVDKVPNKGLSTEDYTTEDKEKLRNIENIIDTKVNSSIGNLVDGAPETFDTLREIADWIENDGVTATELSTSVSNKVDIDVFETSVSDERTLSNEMYVSKSSEQKTELYKGGEMISTSPKIWVGRAETTTSGSWSVDYSDAGFTVPPNVTATAYCRNDGSLNGDAAYASIISASITTTGCSGRLSSATSAGLLAAMVSTAADGSISIIAIGI